MKKMVRFAVEYPVTILMLVFAVLLLGIISFNKLGMDLFPDMNNPRIFVELKTGEQPPEEIERQFVKNIEASAFRLKNVIRISSTSQVGAALITVEYAWNTNMDEAFLDIQKSLENKTIRNRVNIGDTHGKCRKTSGTGSPSGAHGNFLVFGPIDEVCNN